MRTPYRALMHRLSNLEIILSGLLMLTPLILITLTGETRESISNYAYSDLSQVFVFLLVLAGTMFLFNGSATRKWYNIVLGISLIGVSLTPHLDYAIFHYAFAVIFFIGSSFVMIFYSSTKQRWYKIIASAIVIFGLLGAYLGYYSLLYAGWIGMLPITIHFIAESVNKID